MGIAVVLKGVQKLKKKKIQCEVSTSSIWAKFCKVLKIRGYVTKQPKW